MPRIDWFLTYIYKLSYKSVGPSVGITVKDYVSTFLLSICK